MTKKPLLSICIPTYNREKQLKRLLDSIVFQEGFSDEVEIVIDDGPSKDNTESMVKEYQKKYENIRYYRNKKAIGMCPAFLEAISFSNGEYTRLFGSDDVMNKIALGKIIAVIKNKKPTLILSNTFLFKDIVDIDLYKSEESKDLCFDGFSDFGNYLGIKDKKKFTDKINYFSFISLFCFDTKHYRESLDLQLDNYSLSELQHNYFNFALITYANLFIDQRICLIETPCLVFCDIDCGRNYNNKIASDMKILTSYLKKNYKISNSCKYFLNRTYYIWFRASVILPAIKNFLKKLGIDKFLIRVRRKYIIKSRFVD